MKIDFRRVVFTSALFCVGWLFGRVVDSDDAAERIVVMDDSSVEGTGASRTSGLTRAEVEEMIRRARVEPNAPVGDANGSVVVGAELSDVQMEVAPDELANSDDEEASSAETVAQLEAALAAEPVDEEWSYDAELRLEATLQEALADVDPSARLDGVVCGTTFCRANVVSDEGDAYGSTYSAIMNGRFIWHGNGGSVVRSDDSARTQIYVARAGHDLPAVVNPVPGSSI
ncbi:MAG: hypothetical protein H6726_03555 [Sandaracinaceae bacterium]|nr:hypothetical protein [Sandaracinaceae bacterium]